MVGGDVGVQGCSSRSPGLGGGRTQTRPTLGRPLAKAARVCLCVQPKVPASQQGPALVLRDGRVRGGPEAELATEFVESRAE